MAHFTPAQYQALKADILADGVLSVTPNSADGNAQIAAAYSAIASPDFWVWRSSVTKDELVGSTSVDGTTFNWTGAGYITRTQGERDAFSALFSSQGTINPSLANVRQAITDIFSGATAPAPANRTHLSTVSRRLARRWEKLFATGTGSTASPAVLGSANGVTLEGAINGADIEQARAS